MVPFAGIRTSSITHHECMLFTNYFPALFVHHSFTVFPLTGVKMANRNTNVESVIFGELSSKKTKQKRNTWTFDETVRLIAVVGSTDVQEKLDGLVHNHKVWKDVAGALESRHSAEKCHDKWNYLKRKYREVKKKNN